MQTFSSYVATALISGPPEGKHHFLLLDAAVAHGRNMAAELRLSCQAVDVLTGTPCQWRDCASPVLLPLPAHSMGPSAAEPTEQALDKWRYANAFIFIRSDLPTEQMCAALRARTNAVLPQNLDVLLRFFDPRVLDRLLSALTFEQRQAFLSAGKTWAFPDRWGNLRMVQTENGLDTFANPLRLDERQESVLIDAGDADAILSALLDQQHPSLDLLIPPEQYEAVHAATQQAVSSGIKQFSEQVAFCSLWLDLGAGFHEQMPWRQWMQEVKAGKKTFNEVVAMAAESDQV